MGHRCGSALLSEATCMLMEEQAAEEQGEWGV